MKVNARKMRNFGQRVRMARHNKGVTQEKLAEMIGVSTTYVGFIEQGQRLPSIKTADKISRILKIKLSELFG